MSERECRAAGREQASCVPPAHPHLPAGPRRGVRGTAACRNGTCPPAWQGCSGHRGCRPPTPGPQMAHTWCTFLKASLSAHCVPSAGTDLSGTRKDRDLRSEGADGVSCVSSLSPLGWVLPALPCPMAVGLPFHALSSPPSQASLSGVLGASVPHPLWGLCWEPLASAFQLPSTRPGSALPLWVCCLLSGSLGAWQGPGVSQLVRVE